MIEKIKLKVGDKLVRTESNVFGNVEAGEVFTVVEDGMGDIKAKRDSDGYNMGLDLPERWDKLEEANDLDTKVDDLVRVMNPRQIALGPRHFEEGDVGRVVEVHGNRGIRVTSAKRPGETLRIYTSELQYVAKVDVPLIEPEIDLDAILKQIQALETIVAKEVAKRKASKPRGRVKVVEDAKKYVRDTEREFRGLAFEYHVNAEKGAVTTLIRDKYTGRVLAKGIAKVSKEDAFSESVGKAIAVARAVGRVVPEPFLNVPMN